MYREVSAIILLFWVLLSAIWVNAIWVNAFCDMVSLAINQ